MLRVRYHSLVCCMQASGTGGSDLLVLYPLCINAEHQPLQMCICSCIKVADRRSRGHQLHFGELLLQVLVLICTAWTAQLHVYASRLGTCHKYSTSAGSSRRICIADWSAGDAVLPGSFTREIWRETHADSKSSRLQTPQQSLASSAPNVYRNLVSERSATCLLSTS